MSHLDARDVVFSVGRTGRQLRQLWYVRFMAWAGKQSPRRRSDPVQDPAESWRNIRLQNGSKNLQPCKIITRTAQRVS